MDTLPAELIMKIAGSLSDVRAFCCVNKQIAQTCEGLPDWNYWRTRKNISNPKHVMLKMVNIVKYEPNHYALHGNLELFKYLIENGTNVNYINILYNAIGGNQLEIVKYIAENHIDVLTIPLYISVKYGSLEMVKYFVSKGANIREDLSFSLYWSAMNEKLEMLQYFVENVDDIPTECIKSALSATKNGCIVAYLTGLLQG